MMWPDWLHWLRPWWLLALLPLLVFWVWVARRGQAYSAWEALVDPELQPHVLTPSSKRPQLGIQALCVAWFITIVVLAGPVWEQQPVPVYSARPALMVVVDVSPSMMLDDVAPSRMQRAVFKLSDLLNLAKDFEIGLTVFSERPYVVSPLTDDVDTLRAFLPSLGPQIAPIPGSRLNLALDQAVNLLQQANKLQGQILVFTDSVVGDADIQAATAAQQAGFTVSVIGVGTKNGAPLRNANGEFMRDSSGTA